MVPVAHLGATNTSMGREHDCAGRDGRDGQWTAEGAVPTLEDAAQFLGRSHEALDALVPTLTPEALAATFAFTDLQGQARSLPLWVVLRHVPNHSSYQRGQITSRLMEFGVEPPLLDLAVWAGW